MCCVYAWLFRKKLLCRVGSFYRLERHRFCNIYRLENPNTPRSLYPRVRCILPPAVVPQYQTFVTMKAGMNIDYSLHQKGWQMTRDEKDAVILFPDGEKVFIKNGEAIEVKIQSGCSKFILSDCEVIEEECSDKRIFKIIENDHTQYGKYDGDVIFLL